MWRQGFKIEALLNIMNFKLSITLVIKINDVTFVNKCIKTCFIPFNFAM